MAQYTSRQLNLEDVFIEGKLSNEIVALINKTIKAPKQFRASIS